jgi:asparagine synthase (glutamine-hydrolysing)
MCGILGIVDRQARLTASLPAAATRMREALAHRGPDGWGLVTLDGDTIDERAAASPGARRARAAHAPRAAILGHHRLAIIDLSPGGHQPRATPDGRYWITYNGEIYNYRELRADLEAEGVRIHSGSDTEVLLAAFVRHGVRAIDRLRGMFAFAIWDDLEGTLILARDRFGIKPLYWAEPGGGPFVFASEPKACLASGLVAADPNPDADALFLRRGHLPVDASAWRYLTPIPPGHWARWDGSRLTSGEYWSLDALDAGQARHSGLDEAAPALRRALVTSVGAHLVSDVPVGVFLSGGLDSTAIVAAARECRSGPLRTFTVTFPGTPWDEGALAREAAARFATDHTEVALTADDLFAGLDRFFEAMDEPTADGINTFVVAGAARGAGLRVALSGLGGDETLGGYDSFVGVPRLRAWLRVLGCVPASRGLLAALAERAPVRSGRKLAEILREAPRDLAGVWRLYRALFTRAQMHDLMPEPEPPAIGFARHEGPSGTAPQPRLHQPSDPFWAVARCEIGEFMIPQLLRDADTYTMAWGLELRTPFVDHEWLAAVQAAGRWPRRRGESAKTTLFRAMGDFLPAKHLHQPKRGFTLPFDHWLREALGAPRPRDEVLAALQREARYRRVVEAFLAGRLHWSRPWALYVLERFRRQQARRQRPAPCA